MSRKAGNEAEERAVAFLMENGYTILERNFTVRGAEIDIIAREGNCLVFVEVKSSRLMATHPRERVGWSKQARICMAAQHWLQTHGGELEPIRFDVVEITPAHVVLLRAAYDFVSA